MAASTIATFQALLKEKADDNSIVEKLIYPENPLLGMLEKKGDTAMVGDKMPIPVFYQLPQGTASGFSVAQANAGTTKSVQFDVEAGDYHGVVHIGDKIIMASRNNSGAYLENKEVEIDGLWETAGETYSIHSWGNGGLSLGRIASIATNVLTLEEGAMVANFEVGMRLGASANDGATTTDSLRGSPSYSTVTAVSRSLGTVTITASDISGLAAGDYLFREGDFFGDQGVVIVKGLRTWLSATEAPVALWGVTANTRALDNHRLGGVRVDVNLLAGKSFEERIRILLSQMAGRFKTKKPSHGFMHPEDFETLVTLMQAKGQRDLERSTTSFGYTSIRVQTAHGDLPIYTDRHCPKGVFWALRLEDFWMSSMGELIHPQTSDGNQILRRASATDLEYRLIGYPLFCCRSMKNSGQVPLV